MRSILKELKTMDRSLFYFKLVLGGKQMRADSDEWLIIIFRVMARLLLDDLFWWRHSKYIFAIF